MIDAEPGQCAIHPTRAGAITCRHCGSFACSECTVDKLWGETLCAACDARGLARYPLPWDRAASLQGFVRTVRAVLVDTRLLFTAFPQGPLGRALSFAAAVGALWMTIVVAYIAVRGLRHPAARAVPAYVLVVGYGLAFVSWALVPGLGFHFAQIALRGRASFASCMRASAYLTALTLLTMISSVLPSFLGFALIAAQLGLFVWAWVRFARSTADLSSSRAVLAVAAACASGVLAVAVVMLIPTVSYIAITADVPE